MNMTYLLDVANHTGVVTRISLIFRRHGANLQSLSTAKTEHPGIVRIVITSEIERRPAERIKGQLAKLVDVFKVGMISHEEGTFRAFGMMKIACTLQTRPQILQLLEIFNGRVLELTTEWVLVEMTGTPEQLEGLLQVLQPYGILEAVETGPIVIRRNSPGNASRPQPTWEVVPGALFTGGSSTATSTINSTQERKRYGTDLL
jgi:acetolactate synthase I/III small subunit